MIYLASALLINYAYSALLFHPPTGLCVDVQNAYGSGIPYLNKCDKSNPQQQFKSDEVGSSAASDGRCLHVYTSGMRDGAKLVYDQRDWCYNTKAHWEANIREDQVNQRLYVEVDGKRWCLDAGQRAPAIGVPIYMWQCSTSYNPSQTFVVNK